MEYLQLRLLHTDETLHPLHAFEIDHDAFHGSKLLHWNVSLSETNTMVFEVRGKPDIYREQLEIRDDTLTYVVTAAENGTFYCCVRERLTERDRAYVNAVEQESVIVVPPISYNQDMTVDVSLVGTTTGLSVVLDHLPETIDIEVISKGDYRRYVASRSSRLTTRQYQAVEVAVGCGYYDSPRQASMSVIADELDVAPSTAAEHLRKAEKQVMQQVIEGR